MAWTATALYLLLPTFALSYLRSHNVELRRASCRLHVQGVDPNQMSFCGIPKFGIPESYASDLDPSVHHEIKPDDWQGCSPSDVDIISQTWRDASKLVRAIRPIDWSSQAAQEIWGHALDSNCLVPEDVRLRIKTILDMIQETLETHSLFAKKDLSLDPFGPRLQELWLNVRCNCEASDHDNYNEVDGSPRLEAYSTPTEHGAAITFCRQFFRMEALDNVLQDAIAGRTDSSDLWSYQNRARVLLHELAHVVVFKNSPETRHTVEDEEVCLEHRDGVVRVIAYGPQMVKILAQREPEGFCTQHNADSYAWFAVAKYVEERMGS